MILVELVLCGENRSSSIDYSCSSIVIYVMEYLPWGNHRQRS